MLDDTEVLAMQMYFMIRGVSNANVPHNTEVLATRMYLTIQRC